VIAAPPEPPAFRIEPALKKMKITRFTRACSILATGIVAAATVHAADPSVFGYLEPYKIITVSAAEPGVLSDVLVQEGHAVRKGAVLARLDTAVLAAELEIARAEARLAGTRRQRLEELAGSSRATPDELEKARTDAAIKEAQVRRTEAQIESRTLRSPVDGIVTDVKRDPSEAVSAAQPHVLTVVQIDRLAVNLFLPPSRAATLRPGTKAELVLLDESGTRMPAEVEFLSPVTDAASGTVRVKFTIENPNGAHRAGGRCTLAD
jgi:RND family efflux transporter MFP subunit